MSALAKFFACNHCHVYGSDLVKNEQTEELISYGIKTYVGVEENRPILQNVDAVVFTDAIHADNVELKKAKQLNKRIYSRAELLHEVCQLFPEVITVAGSHGKTTCSAMCAHVLKSVGAKFTAHIGGNDREFGNFCSYGREYFLTEACEYKRNILKLSPTRAVLLNIDVDHMECYHGIEDLTDCFKRYAESAKIAVVCADDSRCDNLGEYVTFGIDNELADYRAIRLQSDKERYSFTVTEYGKDLCRVKLQVVGRCNVYNALAAFAVMRTYGFNEKQIAEGLQSFTSIKRRFEKMGEYRGATFICDYAHHPRELLSTISTARKVCEGKLYVIFQPHTYSRTKLLLKDFMNVLSEIEHLIIYKTYAAREEYDEEGSGLFLAEKLSCLYCDNVTSLKTWIEKTVREKDMLLFLGAGDIYYLAEYLSKSLK